MRIHVPKPVKAAVDAALQRCQSFATGSHFMQLQMLLHDGCGMSRVHRSCGLDIAWASHAAGCNCIAAAAEDHEVVAD